MGWQRIRRAVRSGRSSSVPPDAAAWVAVDNEQDLNRSEPLMPAGSPDPGSAAGWGHIALSPVGDRPVTLRWRGRRGRT
jgi:hypothetical protein